MFIFSNADKNHFADFVNSLCGFSVSKFIHLRQFLVCRENWRLNDMAIALDTLEDGFTVGEIELVVNSSSQVSNTL